MLTQYYIIIWLLSRKEITYIYVLLILKDTKLSHINLSINDGVDQLSFYNIIHRLHTKTKKK